MKFNNDDTMKILCPNHQCRLIIPPEEMHLKKGQAPCEISNVLLDYSQETDEALMAKDKFGNLIPTTKVVGND